jgi:hypothetical protein
MELVGAGGRQSRVRNGYGPLTVGTTAAAGAGKTVAVQLQSTSAVATLFTGPASTSAWVIVYGWSAAQAVDASRVGHSARRQGRRQPLSATAVAATDSATVRPVN